MKGERHKWKSLVARIQELCHCANAEDVLFGQLVFSGTGKNQAQVRSAGLRVFGRVLVASKVSFGSEPLTVFRFDFDSVPVITSLRNSLVMVKFDHGLAIA